jgi:hypothetical protein
MKTGTLVNRLFLFLIGLYFVIFCGKAAGQTLTINDIPDQTIEAGQMFSVIDLDDFIDVPNNQLNDIQWSVSGANQLSIEISDTRRATVNPPAESWTGSETVTFHAIDPDMNEGSDAATFTINAAVNAAPVIGDIPDQTVDEGSSFQPVDLDDFVTDDDNPDNEMTWSASGNSSLSVNIDPESHTAIINAPDDNWNGTETIIFKVTDPGSETAEDPATFTLSPVNDAPVISDIPDQSINSGESFSPVSLDNFVTDIDNEKSELEWSVSGNTELTPSVNESRVAGFNQPENWFGSETLTFTVNDPSNASDSDDATFEARAVNPAPVASNDSYSTTQCDRSTSYGPYA